MAGQRDRNAAPRRRQQAAVEQGGMQLARGLQDHAAMIEVAADLLALLLAADQVAVGGAAGAQLVEACAAPLVRGGAGAEEAAALFQVAVDLLLLDEIDQRAIGVDRPADHVAHQLGRIVEAFGR